MLKRKVYEELARWNREGTGAAAFIMGARQIGKSTIAREFGRNCFRQFIEINFIDQPEMKSAFQWDGARNILTALTALTHQTILPGETLILLDEIQECPEARTAIKFLVEEGSARYIETGSLLGVNYREIRSYPVEYETIIPMYPLDFEEFCWAMRIPDETLRYLQGCFEKRQSVLEPVHREMLQMFYTYMIVGGMPAVVRDYVQIPDLAACSRTQKDILHLYRTDIARYARSTEKNKIREIFDSIPDQLDSKNSRFVLSRLKEGARLQRYENSFLWLREVGVALPCFNVSAPVSPLKLNEKRSLFKLFLCDTGLLCEASLGNLQYPLLKGEVDINAGSILENVFAQSIVSKDMDLYYYDQKKFGELDFVLQNGRNIDLFEIKSGNDWKKHSSLTKAIQSAEWEFSGTFVFCKGNLEQQDSILYLPFYMIMFYQPERSPESLLWKPEMNALMSFGLKQTYEI